MESRPDILKIGRYHIMSILGKGGMGTVYKATDPVLGRDVALKVGHPDRFAVSEVAQRPHDQCLKEARLAAQFIHPNIAITYDAGFEKDLFFMALEYVDGEGLQKYCRSSDLLPPQRVMEILYNICYALQFIHEKGYIHLDVKPQNIMLTQAGEVKLMDFGISRLLKDASPNGAATSGSLFYMSPEQTDPKGHLGPQSDIFSLGVVAYQLLTGKRPFQGDDGFQVFYQILHKQPTPIRDLAPNISESLQLAVEKAMAKQPADRFQTARAFAEALQPLIRGADAVVLSKHHLKKIEYMKRLLLFRHFEEHELEAVLQIASWHFHPENTWVTSGQADDRNIYILVLGLASVRVQQKQKRLKPGDCFNESVVIHSMSGKARLWAEKDCVIMTINANLLNQAYPEIQVKFLREFYTNKTVQLVEANLRLIQQGLSG